MNTNLVLVHPAGLMPDTFTGIVQELPADVKPWLPNLAVGSINDQCRTLEDYLDRHELRSVILFGHGTGALVAAQLALAQPNRVSRLLLSDAPLRTDEKTINAQMKALRLIPRFLLRRRGIDKDEAMESLESLRDFDLIGQLGILGIPLTIFSSANTPDTFQSAKVIRVPEGRWYESNPALVVRELLA
ncbi:Haloalkane dehalogenase [Corynebacterium atrinae]|uniref:alpha/beta fold hydrolase n=1 Tax=Corynebacterium atrinae TaxID=1336740 RepID=UPI0025B437B8|nr:alpha/beta hydrolase [Corynebacterium atrinae]WJY64387.1 Haloalkane dehalogenase [Corynebacterium atrinae]